MDAVEPGAVPDAERGSGRPAAAPPWRGGDGRPRQAVARLSSAGTPRATAVDGTWLLSCVNDQVAAGSPAPRHSGSVHYSATGGKPPVPGLGATPCGCW